MSKVADLIQVYNAEKREYEYFVKGFDVSESIKILLKAHKEAYDNERRVFTECKAYWDAEKQFKERIADLEAKLAENQKKYAELFCRNTELETLYSQKTALVNFYKDTDLVKENKKLKQQLADLQSEQIKEMQEHQEAMKLADKTIKELEVKLVLKPSFGKFKSADELYKSYTNLEKEYTKSRQQLAEKEVKLAEKEAELEDWKDGTIVEKLWHLERQLAEKDNALKLAREYMFNVMCADDVPSIEWFIKCAKEKLKNE